MSDDIDAVLKQLEIETKIKGFVIGLTYFLVICASLKILFWM